MKSLFVLFFALFSTSMITGCNGAGDFSDSGLAASGGSAPSFSRSGPGVPVERHYQTDLLIYNGTATAYGDSEALISIAQAHGLTYATVDSAQLNRMSVDDLAQYGALVWPGGYAGQMSGSLTAGARKNVQQAVAMRGMSFIGFCAGAFIAVSPDTSWGFALVPRETMPYYHLEDEGTDSAMVKLKLGDGSNRDIVWWGGPAIPEEVGSVVARYPDTGQAAISQGWSGNGFVILSAGHPEAPADWRTKLGLNDSDGLDQDLAFTLIESALKQSPMTAM